jgi:hypothetical protein
MTASARSSSYHYVVDEPLLRTIAAEIQAVIPGSEVRLYSFGEASGYCSRARGTARPDSVLDLLVTVPDAWLATHSRLEERGDLSWKLAHHRIPIDLLLYSHQEVQDRLQHRQHVVKEAYSHGRELHAF